MPEVLISSHAERSLRLARHGLLADAGGDQHSVELIAASTFGLHAARLSSPWVALRTRWPSFSADALRAALCEHRTVVKVRCMRQTLHILPLDLARVAHRATVHQRVGPCRAALRRLGRSERALLDMADRVQAVVAGAVTVDYRELERRVCRRPGAGEVALARLAIKWLWEHGILCHVDLSPSLHHEHRAFALAAERHPDLGLSVTEPELEDACRELVRHHVRTFGPVALDDTAWWSGLGRATVRRALAELGDDVVQVAVEGLGSDPLYMASDAVGELDAAPLLPVDHVAVLAYEDPSLKGYFATRSRYVRPGDYRALFNQIGEARASVMVGGTVAGIWHFDRRSRHIALEMVRQVPSRVQRDVDDRLADLEGFLTADPMLTGSRA